jgi:hypothetical protein
MNQVERGAAQDVAKELALNTMCPLEEKEPSGLPLSDEEWTWLLELVHRSET